MTTQTKEAFLALCQTLSRTTGYSQPRSALTLIGLLKSSTDFELTTEEILLVDSAMCGELKRANNYAKREAAAEGLADSISTVTDAIKDMFVRR